MNDYLLLLFLVILIFLSAFFSGSEMAFASCNKLRIKKMASEGNKAAGRTDYICNNFNRSISTILIGNNLVNIAASSAATVFAVAHWGIKGETAAPIVMTVVILIFGEIVPKIISADYSDKISLNFSKALRFFMFLFFPVVWLVSKFVDAISKLWTPKETEPAVTQEELYTILDEIEDEGVFSESESELIKSAIDFTDITAHEIVTPRVDVVAFDIDDGIDSILKDENFMRYSRFPVYRDSIDNIIGILSAKRLMKAIIAGDKNKIDLEALLYPPVFVHMTKTISTIINEFRKNHAQMAIVIDEYGGTMGILTMEDIVEEIVGEIFDEYDKVEPDATQTGSNSFEIDGTMNIYDMFELIGFDETDFESECNTAGGWVTEQLDRFPEVGDSFDYRNLTVTVTEAQSMRVDKLIITVHPVEEEDK